MAAVGVRVEVRGWHGVCVWDLGFGGAVLRVVWVGLDGVEVGVFVDSAAEVQSGRGEGSLYRSVRSVRRRKGVGVVYSSLLSLSLRYTRRF